MSFIGAIRQNVQSSAHSLGSAHFKKNFLNALPFWLGAVITGILAVIYARLFAWAEMGTLFIVHQNKWLFLFITPITFMLAVWMVLRYSPFARGSGIPQVTASIELSNPQHHYKVNKLLSLRIIFVKVLSSLVIVFGGGVTGREGPTIQIAASVFKKINDLLPGWYPKISRRNMLITGAAAGLASAFNTPLGGIVFAIEELTKTHFNFFKSALLTGVIIAGFTALYFLGPYLYLGYPQLTNIPLWILWVIIPVALLSGAAGSGMAEVILWLFNKKKRLTRTYQKLAYAGVCGLLIALAAIFIDPGTFGSGKEIMQTTLFTAHKHLAWYTPLLRIIGPVITFSAGAAGGIFAPSLSAGASIGGVMAGWFHLSGTATNLLILCGMVGCLTGITRSPFTSAILVLEMTNSHNIIFHLMLTGLLANLLANLISKHSFYDQLKDQYIHEVHHAAPEQEIPAAVAPKP